jgi:hypothetical protein
MHSIDNAESFKQRLRNGKFCVGTSVQPTGPVEPEFDFPTAWDEVRHP